MTSLRPVADGISCGDLLHLGRAEAIGPGALDQVRRQVKKSGQNPNHWPDVYRYMADRASKNGSYSQAVRYVTRIRAYLETLKQDRALSRL